MGKSLTEFVVTEIGKERKTIKSNRKIQEIIHWKSWEMHNSFSCDNCKESRKIHCILKLNKAKIKARTKKALLLLTLVSSSQPSFCPELLLVFSSWASGILHVFSVVVFEQKCTKSSI